MTNVMDRAVEAVGELTKMIGQIIKAIDDSRYEDAREWAIKAKIKATDIWTLAMNWRTMVGAKDDDEPPTDPA